MAVWSNAAQEAILGGFITGVGTGTGNGSFRLFNASSPPSQLVSANFNSPAFNIPSPSNGVATVNTSPAVVSPAYSGSTDTIGEYRIYDGDGNLLYDAGTITVSSSGGYNVPTLTIENGFAYELLSGRIRIF